MPLERGHSSSGNVKTTNGISYIKTIDGMRNTEKEHSVQILNITGEKGFYQLLVASLCLMSNMVASWNVLGYNFFAYPMDYGCSRPNEGSFQNLTLREWNLLNTITNSTIESSKCFVNEVVYEGDGSFRRTGQTVKCESWEFQDPVFRETIVSKWDLVCDNASKVATSQTVYLIGFLLSVLIFGQLGDSLGRRPVLLFSIVLYLVAGLLTSLVSSFGFFVFFRFLVALGIHGATIMAFVMLMECSGHRYRPLYYLSMSVGWAVGYTTIPGLAFITKDWAYLQLSFVVFGLTLLPLWWYCLESPRWLLTQGKYETAESVLITVAKRNGIWNENTHMKIQEIIFISDMEQKPRDTMKDTLFNLLRTSKMRKKTLTMFYIWFTTAFVYYGISQNWVDFVGDIFADTAIFGSLEFVSAILGLIIFTFTSRKPTFVILFFVVGVLCFCMAGIPDSLRWFHMSLAAVGKILVEICFDLAYIYSAEVFPTSVRSAGVGACSAVARIGTIVAPLMTSMMSATGKVVPLTIFGAVTILAGLLAFRLLETKDKDLQDTLEEEEQCEKFHPCCRRPWW